VLAACAVAFLAERLLEAAGRAPGWASSYLDDLACLPLVLTAVAAVHRAGGRPAHWCLPRLHGLAVVALYVVVFELWLPRRGLGTADLRDAAAYLAGWALYHGLVDPRRPR